MRSNDLVWTAGPPPGTLIGGCYLVRKDATIFLDYVLFLSFEFGLGDFTVRVHLYSLNLAAVVVTLTVVNGYKQCTYLQPLF